MNKADCICELKRLRGVYAGMRKEYGSCVDALDMAINALEQTAWIPCSERIPDAGKTILISDGCEVLIGYYSGGDRWTVDGCEYDPILEEIAWMPLPEPWKGETND